jgi:hypothetical protein
MWSAWTTLNVTPQAGQSPANTIDASSAVNGTLSGTSNNDTFVFAPGFGHETIESFASGIDAIQVDHSIFANVQALLAGTHDDGGGNAVITADANDTIIVKNVTTAALALHQDHFLIV